MTVSKWKAAGGIRGRQHIEREVFLESAAGVEVEAAEVEAGLVVILFRRRRPSR